MLLLLHTHICKYGQSLIIIIIIYLGLIGGRKGGWIHFERNQEASLTFDGRLAQQTRERGDGSQAVGDLTADNTSLNHCPWIHQDF